MELQRVTVLMPLLRRDSDDDVFVVELSRRSEPLPVAPEPRRTSMTSDGFELRLADVCVDRCCSNDTLRFELPFDFYHKTKSNHCEIAVFGNATMKFLGTGRTEA